MSVSKTPHIIRYVRGTKADDDGTIELVYASKKVTKQSFQVYANCQHKLAKVSRCAERLMYFVVERMDSVNTIHHSKNLRSLFRNWMRTKCDLHYEDDTVKKAFYELVEANLIMRHGKVDYTVNPVHFFKGSEKARVELIGTLINHARLSASDQSTVKRALDIN